MSKQDKLKALTEKWYDRLKKEGFEDIESSPDQLKQWHAHRIPCYYTPETYKDKEEYYRLAGQFLHDYEFEKEFDRQVWKLHSEGATFKAIIAELKKKKFPAYLQSVSDTINKLAKIMGKKCL
jgi:hypothetical protein